RAEIAPDLSVRDGDPVSDEGGTEALPSERRGQDRTLLLAHSRGDLAGNTGQSRAFPRSLHAQQDTLRRNQTPQRYGFGPGTGLLRDGDRPPTVTPETCRK